jgi:OOP family OmpA-OmpF porin
MLVGTTLRYCHAMRALWLLLIAVPALADTKFELKGNQLVVPSAVAFDSGGPHLKPSSDAAIAYVKAYLDAKPAITMLRVENHTDNDGSASDNQALSDSRALAVAKALVGKGVDCHRLIAVGFGGTKPVVSNDTPENKAMNRRTDFMNAAMMKHAIGGMPLDGGGHVAGDPCK